jgi:hypothetical protein
MVISSEYGSLIYTEEDGVLEFWIRYEQRGCSGIICSCLARDVRDSSQVFAVVSLSVCLARLYCSRQTFLFGDLTERRPRILTRRPFNIALVA